MTKTKVPTITVECEIDNVYELYDSVTTYKTATIPEPPAGTQQGDDAFEDWASDHLLELTGVGHEDGNSAYFLEIIKCDERPDLVGLEFEWGV